MTHATNNIASASSVTLAVSYLLTTVPLPQVCLPLKEYSRQFYRLLPSIFLLRQNVLNPAKMKIELKFIAFWSSSDVFAE